MLVFSCDSGLYFDGVEASLQPGTHVRRVNGRDLTDEEMIAYYGGLARAHGGTLTARYRTAVCFVADDKIILERADDTLASEPFLLAEKPHIKREKGYPLDALSKEIRTGQYYYDLPDAAFEDNKVDRGFYTFFRNVLLRLAPDLNRN